MKTTKAFTQTDRENLRWCWDKYLKQNVTFLVILLALVVSQGVVYQQFLSLTDSGLRIIFEDGQVSDLVWICFLVFMVFMYRAFTSYIVPRFAAKISSSVIKRMRDDLITHIMTLDLSYFEKQHPSMFTLRLVGQAQALSMFVGQTMVRAGRDFATIVIVSIYLIYKQPILFFLAILFIPLLILAIQFVSNRAKQIQNDAEGATGALMTGIEEIIGSIRTVKISNQTDVEQTRLFKATSNMRELNFKLLSTQAMAQPFVDIAAAIAFVLVIGVGGYTVLSPDFDIDGAEIMTFLFGLVLIFDPGRRLAQFNVQAQISLVRLNKIRTLHKILPQITNHPDATDDFNPHGDLAFQNVNFSYDRSPVLFEDLNLVFKANQKTAIVGTTGSGKTTILSLLARLYEAQSGEILIGGTPVKSIRLEALRGAMSVVSQDIVIFNGSIRDNIRYVRPDATDEDVNQAAKDAELSDLLDTRGDEPVGPKGGLLSGGQRQRIGIARAMLCDRPIVFLDEATSALDQKTEEKVKRALNRLCANKTTIIVSHRLSAVTDADMIIALENGKIIESGTHRMLIDKKGFYQSLFAAQQGEYDV